MNKSEILNGNIKLILEKKKISARSLAKKISMPPSTFNYNLNSKKGFPMETAFSIADELGFPIEELSREDFPERFEESLRAEKDNCFKLTPKESALLHNYRQLSAEGQEAIQNVIDLVVKTFTPNEKDSELLDEMTQIAQSPEA